MARFGPLWQLPFSLKYQLLLTRNAYLAKLANKEVVSVKLDKSNAEIDLYAEVLKAMGHPSRLKFLLALAGGDRCVCELQELVDCDMSTVSRHLSVLRNAGLVESERRGTMIIYSLSCPCILNFLECAGAVIQGKAQRQARALSGD